MTRGLGERGISESAGLAALILLTVVVTASVGINVLFLDSNDGGIQGNFTFTYREDPGFLTVTYAEGDDLNSSKLYLEGPTANATWTELAGSNSSTTVTDGDIIRMGEQGAYGQRISPRDTIEVVYIKNGNRTVLDSWSGSDSGVG